MRLLLLLAPKPPAAPDMDFKTSGGSPQEGKRTMQSSGGGFLHDGWQWHTNVGCRWFSSSSAAAEGSGTQSTLSLLPPPLRIVPRRVRSTPREENSNANITSGGSKGGREKSRWAAGTPLPTAKKLVISSSSSSSSFHVWTLREAHMSDGPGLPLPLPPPPPPPPAPPPPPPSHTSHFHANLNDVAEGTAKGERAFSFPAAAWSLPHWEGFPFLPSPRGSWHGGTGRDSPSSLFFNGLDDVQTTELLGKKGEEDDNLGRPAAAQWSR